MDTAHRMWTQVGKRYALVYGVWQPIYNAEKTNSCESRVSKVQATRQDGERAHVIGRRNGDAVLKWMPAHVQNLLVEINLVRVRLLAHPLALGARRAAGPGTTLLAAVRCRAR